MRFLSYIRAAIWYVKAGDLIEKKRFGESILLIERIRNSTGKKTHSPCFFYIDIREALAALGAGELDRAIASIGTAKDKIYKFTKLSNADKEYLCSFCDILQAEAMGSPGVIKTMTNEQESMVSSRFIAEYPIRYS
ncbi:MAG TPA: hypothetical protein VGF77_11630 [Allosphingosinicella sp.]|jgi:hypothetical protein